MGQIDPSHNPKIGRVPQGVRIYAIGDVHGCVDLLDQVLARVSAHLLQNPIERPIQVFLGDYVDRGPSSRLVIDRLIDWSQGHETVFLKGNHELFFTTFLQDPLILDAWRNLGGLETLSSYGLRPSVKISVNEQEKLASQIDAVMPESHKRFLAELKPFFVCGDYYFVHAGIRPGVALNLQKEDDLLWIRSDFLNHKEQFAKVIVHGHTPVASPEIHANRINIDTGAYATGILTCLVIEGDNLNYV